MSEVKVGKNESLDSALRRFKRTCQRSGVMSEIRKHEHYEKPSVRRKKKSEAARKRKWKKLIKLRVLWLGALVIFKQAVAADGT